MEPVTPNKILQHSRKHLPSSLYPGLHPALSFHIHTLTDAKHSFHRKETLSMCYTATLWRLEDLT